MSKERFKEIKTPTYQKVLAVSIMVTAFLAFIDCLSCLF